MIDNPQDPSQDPDNPAEEDFASLFENYMGDVKDDLRVGEKIKGEIISIGDQSVFINTGTKVDGVVEKAEFLNQDGEIEHQAGDVVELYVVAIEDGEIRLSKAISGPGSENRLHDAKNHAIPVEGRVTEICKGGFKVAVMGKSAFCPVSQIDVAYVEKPEEYLDKTYEFIITRIESRGKNVVVSRRDLLNRYIAEAREKFLNSAKPGDIVDARITKIMTYGAFAEVAPGVEGMIHISELSWKRVENPEEAVSVNDTVKAEILAIEKTTDKGRPVKISLSLKAAAGDPWTDISDRFQEGDKVQGTVTRCADFGAFVELEPGIEGLVHISELSHRRVARAENVVSPGDTVIVMIKGIDPTARRISLSMKDSEGDPWLNITDTYKEGQTIVGRIEKKEAFGYFVEIEPGITGLLPLSKIKGSPRMQEVEKLKTDDSITVAIDAIDTKNRKISLGLGETADTDDWKSYKKEQPQTNADAGLGGLGEKLKAAMKNKKEHPGSEGHGIPVPLYPIAWRKYRL
jgi:small subunit ribosomal protein S1